MCPERSKIKIKNTDNGGHYILPAIPKGSAGTLIGPVHKLN